MRTSELIGVFLVAIGFSLVGCGTASESISSSESNDAKKEWVEGVDYFLPKIDLSNWKVTLPIGRPTEVVPPAVLGYPDNVMLRPFMFNDSTDAALVFHTYPGSTTRNSSYSRTELREQLVPGSNATNWTFAQGGRMKGTLKVDDISKDSDGNYHRTIVMQIHGRLTDAQRNLIGEDDNNAPPVLKIYWNNGRVRVHRKVLKNLEVNDLDILRTDAWEDDARWLGNRVDFEKFTIEVIVSDGRMEVILNEGEANVVFDDIHMQKWGIFENYFKAGNYLLTTDKDSHATVKYYDLVVTH
ncbi:MAG: polysaccharide lyase family 7 protein [Bacteroidota bacterium]